MNFLKNIIGFNENNIINDPMFGELKFNNLSSDYWYGKVNFAPTGTEIKIYIFDLQEVVSEQHKQFYRDLENNFSKIITNTTDLLLKSYTSIGELDRKDVWRIISLEAVSFPTVKNLLEDNFEWDMYYSCDIKKSTFNIEMENWQPTDCYVDT